jgi:hypothetical protein
MAFSVMAGEPVRAAGMGGNAMGRYWLMGLLLSLCGLLGCSATAAFYYQGLRALEAGDYPQATHALSLALVEDPRHVGALTALGIAHHRQDALARARPRPG